MARWLWFDGLSRLALFGSIAFAINIAQ
jgi:hypothetical protein